MPIQNSGGKILYGMHFYPGLAQYNQPNSDSFKIFLNEDTLRKMDASFAGKPIFVEHVEEVDSNLDELRKDADGWVIESFYNSVDGKHWVKMVIVSDKAERAIKNGFRLSNAYLPRMNGKSGEWNGIPYQNEVVDGEYEHLAIVQRPRYEESVIMTPEEFKAYNENLQTELKRIANSKTEEKENAQMVLKFFNRKPVETPVDFDTLSISLPKSGKEYTIFQIVNAMDDVEVKKKENMADLDMKVKISNDKTLSVKELVEKYKDLTEKIENMKKNDDEEADDLDPEDSTIENKDEDEDEEVEADEEEDKKEIKNKKKMKNKEEDDEDEDKDKVKNEKKVNFKTLKNAHLNVKPEANRYDSSDDKLARGRSKYGS